MSAIGRVFIVLNLVLAAAFVGVAGTFLQRHADYKAKFVAAADELAEAKTNHLAQISAKDEELRKAQRELQNRQNSLSNAKAENARLAQDNTALQQQLTAIAGDVANINSSATTMAQNIEQSAAQSKQAYEMAMQAVADKDQALSAREAADTALSEANVQIASLEERLVQSNSRIAALEQENSEKDVLLATAVRRAPGILELAMPDLRGIVHTVGPAGSSILTVRVTDNPAEAAVKPGYSMAIFKGETYKGEAVVQDVNGEFAFCKLTRRVDGTNVAIGDSVATNTGW